MLNWHSVPPSASAMRLCRGVRERECAGFSGGVGDSPSRADRTARRPVRGGVTVAHDERRLQVLRAIVQDFVSTNDPVGSKALAERHDLGVSPATIRNDMAVLEEQGYITQPHTSAGPGPPDKGHRLVGGPPAPG